MAGTRPSDKPHVSTGSPIINGDALFVTNSDEDRNLDFATLQAIIRDGTGLETDADKDNLTFPSRREFVAVTSPDGGTYRIANGKIEFLNPDDSQWYTISVSKSGGKTIKWKSGSNSPFEAVSVNSNGVIQSPLNFVNANNLVTANGGQLANIKAGIGLIGQDFNGSQTKTWQVDEAYIRTLIGQIAESTSFLKAPTGETVEITVNIKNGIPTLSPKVVTNE